MRRLRAAYVLGADALGRIYGPEERAQVLRWTDGEPPVLTGEQAAAGTRALEDVEVVLSGWGAPVMDEAFLAQAPRLRAVLYGAGSVRGFVTDALVERGVVVSSAVSGNAVPVADYTVAAVHLSLKRLWSFLRAPDARAEASVLASVQGTYGATVGLVGLGEVGRQVCRRLAGSGVQLLAHDPYVGEAEARELGVRLVGLEELFASCEVLSVHAPLHEGTRGMITAAHLGAMPVGATLLNTARGAVIRPDDLVRVLTERPDLQAVLDVTEPEPLPADAPLRALPNVVLTPHIAGSLGRECRRMGAMMAQELERLAHGQPLRWPVDLGRLAVAALP